MGEVGGGASWGEAPADPDTSRNSSSEKSTPLGSSDHALEALPPEHRAALLRACSHLEDESLDDVVNATGAEMGAFRVVHGGREEGPPLTLSPMVEADLIKFDQILEKDAMAPKILGIHAGMKAEQKAAAVVKRRTKLQSFAASVAAQAMGQGLHTGLSSMGFNILRQLHGASQIYPPGTQVLKLRIERFLDGMLAEQVPQNWSARGGWRSHTRYPVEIQSTRGPWAGSQDVAALYSWALSTVMGSQANATPVLFCGEAVDDSLIVEGNSEIPAVKTVVWSREIQVPTLEGLLREGAMVADEDEGQFFERAHSGKSAVVVVEEAVNAARDELSKEAAEGLLVERDGSRVTSAGNLTVIIETTSAPHGSGRIGTVSMVTTVLWKIKSISINTAVDGSVVCPELEVFSAERIALLEAGVNNGEVPDVFVLAAVLVRRLNDLSSDAPDNHTMIQVPEQVAAVTWRHFCQQMSGTGAEMAALLSFSTLMLVRPEPNAVATDATDEDVAWLGKTMLGGGSTPAEARALVKRRTGLNSVLQHSARTEVTLGTLSPLTLYYVENQGIIKHPGTVALYERNSPDGIRLACKKVSLLQTAFMDRDVAHAGGDHLLYICGVGFRDIGQGQFGPAVLQTQVYALEKELMQAFEDKFSGAWSATVRFHSRQPAQTALGSTLWTRLRRTTGAGESPERIPPYVWSTLVGDGLEYLPSATIPDLSSSEAIDPTIDGSEELTHGHVVSVAGGSLGRPIFATRGGTGVEDAANPPYLVVSSSGQRLGPRFAGGGFSVGSYWAATFDTALQTSARHGALTTYSRTMGTVPYATNIRDRLYDTLIDLPLRRSSHASHCLVNVCTPLTIRASAARSIPVPTSSARRGLDRIFR